MAAPNLLTAQTGGSPCFTPRPHGCFGFWNELPHPLTAPQRPDLLHEMDERHGWTRRQCRVRMASTCRCPCGGPCSRTASAAWACRRAAVAALRHAGSRGRGGRLELGEAHGPQRLLQGWGYRQCTRSGEYTTSQACLSCAPAPSRPPAGPEGGPSLSPRSPPPAAALGPAGSARGATRRRRPAAGQAPSPVHVCGSVAEAQSGGNDGRRSSAREAQLCALIRHVCTQGGATITTMPSHPQADTQALHRA
jgi:hypothetical protein